MVVHLTCELVRECLSARLDGEPGAVSDQLIDEHLRGCTSCQGWQLQAQRITRVLRVREAAAHDDLAIRVLDTAGRPQGRWSMRRARLQGVGARLALLAIGIAQLIMTGVSMVTGEHGGHDMAGMALHMFNESAAWNLALGAGFIVAAARPRLAAGLLPTIWVFLAVLGVVSVVDLLRGDATVMRVATHILVVAGALLLLMVSQSLRNPGPSSLTSRQDDLVLLGAPDLDEQSAAAHRWEDKSELPPSAKRPA